MQQSTEQYIIHLVNYDHEKSTDIITPKEQIKINVKKPSFQVSEIRVVSPDFSETKIIDFTEKNDSLDFILPSLDLYNVIILSSQSESDVSLDRPQNNGLYFFDRFIRLLPISKTTIIGDLTITISSSKDDIVDKVEFIVDHKLKSVDEDPPFEWNWNQKSFGEHHVKILVSYTNGSQESFERTVLKIF
jgi:hypothetical protein